MHANLWHGLTELKLNSTEMQQQQWLQYLDELAKWNKVFNLTAITEPAQMLSHHLFDSLAVVPFINGSHIIDVGTGAGLPGIPLAIYFPEKRFTLLDSNGKKTRFLKQMRAILPLENVTVVQSRVEQFQPEQPFDQIIARAFAPMPKLLALTDHLCAPGGQFLIMAGQHPAEALTTLPDGVQCLAATALDVPQLDAARHVVQLQKQKG